MFKTSKWLLPALGLLLAGAAAAQTADGAKFYKLDFAVKEVEGGKVVNSRLFSTILAVNVPGANREQASIRAGGKVPFTSGTPSGTSTQFLDLGVNLDMNQLREVSPNEVALNISADISSVAHGASSSMPIIRQNKWSSGVLVTVKKPTVVFASDDVESKGQMQLEVTATPVK